MLDAITLQFVTIGCTEYLVAGNLGGDDLANDILVGKANNQTVLWRIVLVLGLGDEALAGIVVGLACSTTLVFGLVAAAEMSVGYRVAHIGTILTCSMHCS